MHLKLIEPGAQRFDVPVMSQIKLSSRGLLGYDRQQLIKRAGAQFAHELDKLAFTHGEIPIHLLAVGATEFFGSNRNGDGFKERTCADSHSTFKKLAMFYRDHLNKDRARSYGIVKHSMYNESMKRIELIVGLNGTSEAATRNGGLLADRELEKLARDEDIAVSMACVTDPDYPVLVRDKGYISISHVVAGDYVWTHRQRWQPVKAINRRRYTGEVLTFAMNGLPLPLEVTADHPMFATVFSGSRSTEAVRAKATRYFKDAAAFTKMPADWCHASHIGVGDRFFYKPITRYVGYGRIACPDLATLMGYYLAEGSFCYNNETACTTEFSCNLQDSAPRRIPQILSRLYPDITVDIRPHRNSASGLVVSIYSTPFSEYLRKQVGAGCKSKVIPPEIFNANDEVKLAFLGAWLDGDGWLDKKGVHWSSASRNLVLQGRDLLAMLGIPASIYKIDHAACPTSGKPGSGLEYTLNVSHLDGWRLSATSEKAAAYAVPQSNRTKPSCMRYCPDGSYAYRIKSVTSRFVSDQETFNFEVEEDESYTLAGLISHNCRVAYDQCSHCGHKATSREQYCDDVANGGHCKAGGLEHNIGRLLEDGSVLHADNPHPNFFDISHVWRPADRIAYVSGQLEKAASLNGTIPSGALAEAIGLTMPYEILVSSEMPANVAHQIKLAYQLADAETTLVVTNQALAFAREAREPLSPPPGGQQKFGQVLRALADAQMLLPVREYLSLVTDLDEKQAAAAAELVQAQLPGIFSRLLAAPDLGDKLRDNPYSPAPATTPALRMWAQKHAADLSLREPYLSRRIHLAAIRQAPTPTQRTTVKLAAASPAAAKLAEHYCLYKIAFLEAVSQTHADLPLLQSLLLLQHYE